MWVMIWIICGIAASAVASGKGRSGVGWILIGLLLGPLALLGAMMLSRDPAQAERAGYQSGALRDCPRCAETVKAQARVCRFCGTKLEPERYDLLGRRIDDRL